MANPDDTFALALTRFSDEVFDWCARLAESELVAGRHEQAAAWCRLAARLAQNFAVSRLASPELESVLGRLGRAVIKRSGESSLHPVVGDAPRPCLHVLTEAYSTGGHTALCRRWIEAVSELAHSVVLTGQSLAAVPAVLAQAAVSSGGLVHSLDPSRGLVGRAEDLASLAAGYDLVVLHIHMWDPVAPIAFASPGGPPVVLVNHADHVFWLGAQTPDLVLNIRPSGEDACVKNRGRSQDACLRFPLPLPTPPLQKQKLTETVRRELAIPDDSALLLTIGSAYKYNPTPELDFFRAVEQVLAAAPTAHLLAIGPDPSEPRWAHLQHITKGRARALGRKDDIVPYLAAADVYLEGFPFGSLTALLEAGLSGLPAVLAPQDCPLPFRSDDFAIDGDSPANVQNYIQETLKLITNLEHRLEAGKHLQNRVRALHCPPRWQAASAEVVSRCRSIGRHRVPKATMVEPLAPAALLHWSKFTIMGARGDDPLSFVRRNCVAEGLRPRIDARLVGTALSFSFKFKLQRVLKNLCGVALLALTPRLLFKAGK